MSQVALNSLSKRLWGMTNSVRSAKRGAISTRGWFSLGEPFSSSQILGTLVIPHIVGC